MVKSEVLHYLKSSAHRWPRDKWNGDMRRTSDADALIAGIDFYSPSLIYDLI